MAAATEPPPTAAKINSAATLALAFGAGAALWLTYGNQWVVLALVPWASGLAALAVTDLRNHSLPRRTVYTTGIATAAALTVASGATGNWAQLGTAVLCAAAAALVLGAVWLATPNSIGFGDVRLAALAALMLGWLAPILVFAAFAAAQLCCLAVVTVLAAAKQVTRRTEIPLGTFIALASIATAALAFGR